MTNRKMPTVWEFLFVGIIIAVLVLLVLPNVIIPHQNTRIDCIPNEKQLGLAMIQYAQDYDNTLPSGLHKTGMGWGGQIYYYVRNALVFHCPEDDTSARPTRFVVSYGCNANTALLPALSKYSTPAATVLLFEVSGAAANVMLPIEGATQGATAFSAAGDGTDGALSAGRAMPKYATGNIGRRLCAPVSQFTSPRHTGGSNFLFSDGHVKWFRPTEISSGRNAVKPTDEQTGLMRGNAAGTENMAYRGTFSVK